ncbi:MAG TPA: 5-oxoprolinase subunit PxpB [Mycobacteriales bacterium]
MRILRYGREALLVELAGLGEVTGLHRALSEALPPGVAELVPAARTLLVTYDPAATTHDAVAAVVRGTDVTAATAGRGPLVELPVTYDGPDLEEVARLAGLPADEVARRHAAAEYAVAFCGFAPGFAYLTGGDPALRVPRRSTPRTTVPAGAVGLADEFTGVYPRPSPGGWQLLGTTGAPLWDADRDPPALLAPGTRVRFVP